MSHALLTSALDGGEWSASCSSHYTPFLKAPGTHWTRSQDSPRASLMKRNIPVAAGNLTLVIQTIASKITKLSQPMVIK
jgi:hypothetical protein